MDGSVVNIDVDGTASFEPLFGLSNYTTDDNVTMYAYDITKDLESKQLSDVLHRMLELNIQFSLHSLRVDRERKDARCLRIDGKVSFNDRNHNGQVVVKLTTLTLPEKCPFSSEDAQQCEQYSKTECYFVIVFAILTAIGDFLMFIAGSYILILQGQVNREYQSLSYWDETVVYLGSGCLLTWFSFLRFIRIHEKFSLLFKTIRKAAVDVIFFLVCVAMIFVGFVFCTYIVLGPYHVKFRKMETTAETLFSMINGDEIFETFSILQESNVGDVHMIWWFSRIAIYSFVSLFTILVFNLLIALFNSAYEAVREQSQQSSKQSLSDILCEKLVSCQKCDILFPTCSKCCCCGCCKDKTSNNGSEK